MKITKAILPVAGKGTRVMPLTLHQPKGMIALADKPMIHYVMDEMISSGIEEVIMVLGKNQEVFKDYLKHLAKEGVWNHIKFHFVYQKKPLGDGDAIMQAKKLLKKDEPFVVAFADDVFGAGYSPLKEMIDNFHKTDSPTLLLEKVKKELVSKSGVVKPAKTKNGDFVSVVGIVEKPKVEEAPSNMVIIGRYALPYKIFDYLKKLYPYRDREIRIAYALELYLKEHSNIWGYNSKKLRFDCGSKDGLVLAQAFFCINHPHVKKNLKKLLI